MYPEICKIGPFVIYAYGLLLAVAFIVSSGLAGRDAQKHNINPDVIFNLCFLIFICGIAGARILYVLENLNYYLRFPLEIIMLQRGGLSWYGGLACGILCGILYIKKHKLPLNKILDLIAPYIALGQAIGRIGCFLNGCCFGKASKFGIYFPAQNNTLMPIQLYSALLLFIIFIYLKVAAKRPHPESQIFMLYLFLYSLKRFFIEFWRADNPAIFFGLTLFQMISLVIFIFAATRLFLLRKFQDKNAAI